MTFDTFLTGINWNLIFLVAEMGIAFLFLVAFALVVWWFLTFKYSVQIIERRGDKDQIERYDYGRIQKIKEGEYRLKLFWLRKTITVPDFTFVKNLEGSFFRKRKITLYRSGEDSFDPVRYETAIKSIEVKPIEKDLELGMSILRQQDSKIHQTNKWMELMPLAISALSLVVMLVFIIFIVKGINGTNAQMANVAAAFKEAAVALGQCQAQPSGVGFA